MLMENGGWYEDFEVGQTIVSPGKTLTEAEIISFALTYDPQPFHIDAVAAARSDYGGIIGSGWQLCALTFRLFLATAPFAEGASLGSPGCDALRWIRPVRPGDTVYVRATVTEKRRSRSQPDRGQFVLAWEVRNQREEIVMTMSSVQLIRCNPADNP